MNITPNLERVHWDNVRDNQIGGETDGISPEVAADLGYTTPETLQTLDDTALRQLEQPTHPPVQHSWAERCRIARERGIAPEEVGLDPQDRNLLR